MSGTARAAAPTAVPVADPADLAASEPAGPLRLGTRRSALATTQSTLVAELLARSSGRDVELVEVVTHGDLSSAPLSTIGGTGVFASALRAALLAGEVDLAVHSLKDLPTTPAPGLVLAAVPRREDPRDALVARGGATLETLPRGARVGTGSPRRAAQLRAARPDLDVVDVRGNVGTRLALVDDGVLDAVVLARAGLLRLGLEARVTQVLEPDVVLPAPGQGALAVECRADDAVTAAACSVLDHALSRAEVTAERALLAALEAGCTSPVGALALADDGGSVRLSAVVCSPDGARAVARSATSAPAGLDAGLTAAALGCDLARALLDDGAAALVAAPPTATVAPDGPGTTDAPPTPDHPRRARSTPDAGDTQRETADRPPERRHP